MPKQGTIQRACETCSATFFTKAYIVRKGQGRFCSLLCARSAMGSPGAKNPRWQGGNEERSCPSCGNPFIARRSKITLGYGRYCSHACRQRGKSGALAPNWRGGRSSHGAGYVLIWNPDGPHMLEHRVVMENILGRPLESWEVVHHINHIKTDNRPENLQLMTQSEHMRLHQSERRSSD